MRLIRTGPLVLGLVWLWAVCPVEAQRLGCDTFAGVWDYTEPSPPGRAVIAKLGNKYTLAFFQTVKPAASAPSGSVATFTAGVSEYTCEGSEGKYRWKMRTLHSVRPEDVGVETALEMELQGESAKWWFIGADGKRGNPGAAKRVK